MTTISYSGGNAVIRYDGVALLCYCGITGDLIPAATSGSGKASTIDRISIRGAIMTIRQRDGFETIAYKGVAGEWYTAQRLFEPTKPNRPTGLNPNGVIAAPNSTLVLSWTHNPTDGTAQTSYQLRVRRNGGSWTTLSGTTAQTRSYTFTQAGNYEWQVRTRGRSLEWSDWSAIATITSASVPLAPNNLTPSGNTYDWQTAITFRWSHRPTDGTSQTAFEWRIRRGTSGTWTTRTGTTATSTTFTPSNSGLYQWQARTKGAHPSWSPWSAVATITMREEVLPDAYWWPFPESTITSGYKPPNRPTHQAVDFGNPPAVRGAPIRCFAAGVVDRVGTDIYGGLYFTVDHGTIPGYGRVWSHYVHQDTHIVSSGQSVAAGQTVGYIGNSGNSTGPHLHFQLNLEANPFTNSTLNPVTVLRALGAAGR